ncbi:hypothetical protein CBR_g45437 [Chara braunii]|uniref:PHD-type domain-containing protein n=1 Tax=Chara braunii TaxID=69332 RepID=A0A388LYH2_CHABU|nr:hypothetical protein CBR_g45437 [Chara braunii]|eukprot:GBG87380.1 hypothetical protein CBR_g45437 [Chara braunii]
MYVIAHTVACRLAERASNWSGKTKREWCRHVEETWTLGRGPIRVDIGTEADTTVTYLAPTVELCDWLINDRRVEEIRAAEVQGQVRLLPWKLPTEMQVERLPNGSGGHGSKCISRRFWRLCGWEGPWSTSTGQLRKSKSSTTRNVNIPGGRARERGHEDMVRVTGQRSIRKVKRGGGCRCNVSWAGGVDDPMQSDEPHWLFGKERKRKAEQSSGEERGQQMPGAEQQRAGREQGSQAETQPKTKEDVKTPETQPANGQQASSEELVQGGKKEGKEGDKDSDSSRQAKQTGGVGMEEDGKGAAMTQEEDGTAQGKMADLGSSLTGEGEGCDFRRQGRQRRGTEERRGAGSEPGHCTTGIDGRWARLRRGKGTEEIGSRRRMWEQLQTVTLDVNKIIIAGDFSLVAVPVLDSATARHVEADSLELLSGRTALGCTDSYRTLHPQDREFTFWGNAVTRRSRIDMIWASVSRIYTIWASVELTEAIEQVHIVPMETSDHSALIASYPVGQLEKGHPPKAIPGCVFKSEEFQPEVARFWEEWIDECPQENLFAHVAKAIQDLRERLVKQLRSSYLAHQRTREEYTRRMEELNIGLVGEQTEDEWWAEWVEAARGWRELGTRKMAPLMTAMDPPFDDNQPTQRTTRGILKCIRDFYYLLLTEEEDWTPEDIAKEPEQAVWRHIRSGLDLASTCGLEKDVKTEEVERVVADLPCLKAPDLDGMPVEVYKEFHNFFVILLTTAYNEVRKHGSFPQSFAEAYVVLLYKKGAKEDVRNWRLISILTALCKILAKVMATCVKEVLPHLIDCTQTGFVSGCQIPSYVILAQQILEEDRTDAQAAPRLSSPLTSRKRMTVNGVRSDKLKVTRTVRQGCPLSPALYVIYIDSMHDILRADDRLIALKVGLSMELQSTAFADGLIAVIPLTALQLGVLKYDPQTFCKYSGARVNWQKLKAILPLEVDPSEGWDIPTVTEGERLAFLGANLTLSYGGIEQMALRSTAAVARLKPWSARGSMGVFRRALVIKNSVLATLWYAGVAHIPGKCTFRYIRKAINAHLWSNNAQAEDSICRVAWNKLIQPSRFGGLGLLDPRLQIIALQLRQLIWHLLATKYNPTEEELREVVDPYSSALCTECHSGVDDELLLLCDRCDAAAHTYCIGLGNSVPEGEYICSLCRSVDERLQQAAALAGGANGAEADAEAFSGWETGEGEWGSSECDSTEADDASDGSRSDEAEDSEDDNEASEYEEVVTVARIHRATRRASSRSQNATVSRARQGGGRTRRRATGTRRRGRTRRRATSTRRPAQRAARTVAQRAAARTGRRASATRRSATRRASGSAGTRHQTISAVIDRMRRNGNSRVRQTHALLAHFVHLSRPALAARSAVPVAARRPAPSRQTSVQNPRNPAPVASNRHPAPPTAELSNQTVHVDGAGQHDVVNRYREQWDALRNGTMTFASPSRRGPVGPGAASDVQSRRGATAPQSSLRTPLSSESPLAAVTSSSVARRAVSTGQPSGNLGGSGMDATGSVQRRIAIRQPNLDQVWLNAARARSLLLSLRRGSLASSSEDQPAAAGSGGGTVESAAVRSQQTARAHGNSAVANSALGQRTFRANVSSSAQDFGATASRARTSLVHQPAAAVGDRGSAGLAAARHQQAPRAQGNSPLVGNNAVGQQTVRSRVNSSVPENGAVSDETQAGLALPRANQNGDGNRRALRLGATGLTSAVSQATTHAHFHGHLSTTAQAKLASASVDQNGDGGRHVNASNVQTTTSSANVTVRLQVHGTNSMSIGAQTAVPVGCADHNRNRGRQLKSTSAAASALAVNGGAGADARTSSLSTEAQAELSPAPSELNKADGRHGSCRDSPVRGECGLVVRTTGVKGVEGGQGIARTSDLVVEGAATPSAVQDGGSSGEVAEPGLPCTVVPNEGSAGAAAQVGISSNVVICRPPLVAEANQAEGSVAGQPTSSSRPAKHGLPLDGALKKILEEPMSSHSVSDAALPDSEPPKRSSTSSCHGDFRPGFAAERQEAVSAGGSRCARTTDRGNAGRQGGQGDGEEAGMAAGAGKMAKRAKGARGDADIKGRLTPQLDGRTSGGQPEATVRTEDISTARSGSAGRARPYNTLKKEDPSVLSYQTWSDRGQEDSSGICWPLVVPSKVHGQDSVHNSLGQVDNLREFDHHEGRERRPSSYENMSCMMAELKEVRLGSDRGGWVGESRRLETCVNGGEAMMTDATSAWANMSIGEHENTNWMGPLNDSWADGHRGINPCQHQQEIYQSSAYEQTWAQSAPSSAAGGWPANSRWPGREWEWQQPTSYSGSYERHSDEHVSLPPHPVNKELPEWRGNQTEDCARWEWRNNQAVDCARGEWRDNQAVDCAGWQWRDNQAVGCAEQTMHLQGGGGGGGSLLAGNAPQMGAHHTQTPPWQAGGMWCSEQRNLTGLETQRHHHGRSLGIDVHSDQGWGFGTQNMSQAQTSLTSGRSFATGNMVWDEQLPRAKDSLMGRENGGMVLPAPSSWPLMGRENGGMVLPAPSSWPPFPPVGNGLREVERMSRGMMPGVAVSHPPEMLPRVGNCERNDDLSSGGAVAGGGSFPGMGKLSPGYTVQGVGPAQAVGASALEQKLANREGDITLRDRQAIKAEVVGEKQDTGEEVREKEGHQEKDRRKKEARKLQKEKTKEWSSQRPIAGELAAKLVKKELRPLYDDKKIDKEKFKAAARAATHSLLEEWGYSSIQSIGETAQSRCRHGVLVPACLGSGIKPESFEMAVMDKVCAKCVESHVYRALVDDLMKAKG